MRQGELTIGRWPRDRALVTPDRVAITVLGNAAGDRPRR